MDNSDSVLTLAERPKWWLPRLFKWLSVILLVIGILAWIVSEIIKIYLGSIIESFDNENINEDVQDHFLTEVSDSMYSASIYFVDLMFTVLFLWLLAIAVDKLDELVWVNASDKDKAYIISKRKKKNAKHT